MPDNSPDPQEQGIEISAEGNSGDIKAANAGRDGYVAGRDVIIHQPPAVTPTAERSPDEELLYDQVLQEVTSRLKSSLHHSALIKLGLRDDSNQVKARPWSSSRINVEVNKILDLSAGALGVFDQNEVGGKLLILGKPGSGKTTTLLDVANELLDRAAKSAKAPTPALFNLSSWQQDKQSIADWLVAELNSKYGVRQELGQKLLEEHRLVPLLDGLDELATHRQELCVKRLNEWLGSELRAMNVVVCSRIQEYKNYPTKLCLGGAVYLRPLAREQIKFYLTRVGKEDLWHEIEQDMRLLLLARIPLHMSMMLLAYSPEFARRWQQVNDRDARLQLLLESYVQRMLRDRERSGSKLEEEEFSAEQIQKGLIRLAKQLKNESKDEFLIEQMQPALLATAQQKLAYGLIVGLIEGLIVGLIGGLIGGLIVGLIGGLIEVFDEQVKHFKSFFPKSWCSNSSRIDPVESFNLSFSRFARKEFFRTIGGWLIVGLIFGLILGLIFGLIFGLIVGLIFGLIVGLILGLIGGLILGLIFGLKQNIAIRVNPNEGILKSRNNTIILTLGAIALAIAFNFILPPFLSYWLETDLVDRIVSASQAMLVWTTWYSTGGFACAQHLSLRLVLWATGQIPWNYARFLNHCTDRLLLQRVGGRYRFIHKRLQDHFAAMPLDP